MTHGTRMAGLEMIETKPIFFAINDGKNTKSVLIIEALRQSYSTDNHAQSSSPLCMLFENLEAASVVIDHNAVMIFDGEVQRKCFSPMYREAKGCGRKRFPTLWGLVVNPRLKQERIATAVNQLRADFDLRFFERLNTGSLPWGNSKSPVNSRTRRRRLMGRESRKKTRLQRYMF